MNLKELRLSKGLTQKECAKYLNISLRSYQIYENDLSENKSTKYMMIFNKLQSYTSDEVTKEELHFYTNVISNNNLLFLYEKVKTYKKRDCFQSLEKFIKESNCGKICAIYGLRRTGKTTLIFQMLGELPIDKTAYIKVQVTDSMANLTKDLYTLHNAGYKYVFIDEITLLSDFINTAAVLSDVFSMMDMKIIVSGIDSLGFMMASRDELYDCCIMVHTSFIPFREYYRLLNIHSIDKYIEYGGTLKMENMSFDDSDINNDEVSFRNDESTRKYIDTAISRNIQNTLKNDHYGEYFNQLKELYNNGELTNVINRIVENINHDFLLKVIEDKFKSHDFGSAKDLLLHDAPSLRAYVLNDVDKLGKKVVTYSIENSSDFRAENIRLEEKDIIFDCNSTSYKFVLPGEYNIYNALGTIAAAKELNISEECIKAGLLDVVVPGRCERIGDKYDIPYEIIIDFAHTPDGMKNILETLKSFAKNRLIAVYGSGGDRDKVKRAELGRVGSEIADLVIITSDNPRHEDPMAIIKDIVVGIEKTNYLAIENRSEAIRLALKMAEPGDVVVLAGKGHETYQINNEGVIHFDEREVVDEILSGK